MGFSVSSSTIIIFIAFLLSFSVFYGSWSSSQDILSETKKETVNNRVEKIQTDIQIVNAEFISSNSDIIINTSNTGSTTLEIKDVTIIINGKYQDNNEFEFKIFKNNETIESNYWYPNEYLVAKRLIGSPNGSVKVIVENGISDISGYK